VPAMPAPVAMPMRSLENAPLYENDLERYAELRSALSDELQGDRAGAVRRFQSILDRHPDFTDARGHFAWIRHVQGNTPEALALLLEVLHQTPEDHWAAQLRFDIAREALDVGAARESIPYMDDSQKAEAETELNHLENRIHRTEFTPGHRKDFESAMERMEKGDLDEPLSVLKILYEDYPSIPEVAYFYAHQILFQRGREVHESDRAAIVVFRRLWETKNFEDSSAWVSLLSYKLQDYQTCAKATLAALESDDGDPELRERLAIALENLEDYGEAIARYRDALNRRPHRAGIALNLYALLDKTGQQEAAEALKRKLTRKNADYPVLDAFRSHGCSRRPEYRRRERVGNEGWAGFVENPWKAVKDLLVSPKREAERAHRKLQFETGFRSVPCNLCGGASFTGVAVCPDNGWPVMRCHECGLLQTTPQPPQETLSRKYQEDYYSIETIRGMHEKAPVGGVPLLMLQRITSWLEECGLNEFSAGLESPTMLDVGCGTGILMRDFGILGWECEGTEVSRPISAFLEQELGYRIHEGLIRNLILPEDYYDLVCLNQVLEHVLDPLADLRRIRELLEPGGWLFVATPGADSIPAKLASVDWFYDPDHVFFFSRKTLFAMLEKAGFEILADKSYVGVGHETWDEAWLDEGIGPTVTGKVEEANQGDVLMVLARRPG